MLPCVYRQRDDDVLVLVLCSWGALFAQIWEERNKGRVRRLVLLDVLVLLPWWYFGLGLLTSANACAAEQVTPGETPFVDGFFTGLHKTFFMVL